ncbi:hypothetical protein PBI_KAMPE_33 [Gordonia phage Kampe]|uniref:Uncharacterized protein n=3 Tax=Gordonia phage Orchid TaxID=1838075 RepID=A0A160DJI3_9CAUD|nr:hypothetical protein BH761_gp033 [Gordonia phage Orchid]ANA87267.1 hypothetical protein PBI_PATRICKSTAR_33 [Gordonia phage PatrickStar]ANA87380.1 hypothetical protein PBI_ORCHID_33 [Gordonia phage Orchid]ANA87494.1 hypothetical protein PBI_KAMPE_33 [Gordonia phage Kampe]AXH46485.1 hypothetical protein SEA_ROBINSPARKLES_36 [Gordonia phage RobinSparkles]
MAISDYANVVKFPSEEKLALYPEIDFAYEFTPPNDHQVSNTDLVIMKVSDPLSLQVLYSWTATNDVDNNKHRFRVPYSDIIYLPHGARYRIYLQYGLPDTKIFHQMGPMIWIGR